MEQITIVPCSRDNHIKFEISLHFWWIWPTVWRPWSKPLCLSVPSNNLGLRDFESLFSGWNVASTVMKGIFKVTSFFDIRFFWSWVATFFSHYFWPTKIEKDTCSNRGKVQKQRKSQKGPIQILSHFFEFFLMSVRLCASFENVVCKRQ